MANNNERLLTVRILETPAGREVSDAFITSLFNTMDVEESINKAKEAAEMNGTLLPLQISFIIDILTILGPLIIANLKK